MDGMRVLLVDDEEELVETIAERLELRGIVAETVTNGEEALQRVLEKPFDVVLLDVKMPGLGGMEVLKLIRMQRPNTQVILITGHASVENGDRRLLEGAFDFIVKPVDIEVLVDKMKEATQRRKESDKP
ncbi:MAG TPA: response regulator [Polyangiaceae bacterium]|jgi:DNA-binding NtrC family response regulator|nr:MAG: Nitrogen regulation protein NR(I) [Deltaproteobacteria bacterium ADurb.Bin207]HNS96570.1 response regulator [Polyangiaceae bacterium]HNZ24803.1 response regulator [Polyangiaceae bacterium]HOD22019.1 response regulator [Polyangiaceae bacterium]HOE47985.1 response regulator [Polyangiaceae bacterium]